MGIQQNVSIDSVKKAMRFLDILKRKKDKQPEDEFTVTITETLIKVEHPKRKTEQVLWDNIEEIKLVNTDQGPWGIDIFLVLIGENDGCVIPHGAKGFDEIYDRISRYDGFNFERFGKSMACTDNAEFILWVKKL